MITYTPEGPQVEINHVWSICYKDGAYILQKRGHPFRSYKDVKAMAGETHRFLGGGFSYEQYCELLELKRQAEGDDIEEEITPEPVKPGVSYWLP